MNKYFTEEYMELCKNEKIRKLKLVPQCGDWYFPSGDQLERAIFKILEELSKDEDIEYSFEVSFIDNKMTAFRLTIENEDNVQGEVNTNPLVAKIKTLIDLLEAK